MYRCSKKKQEILEIVVRRFEDARDNYFNIDMSTVTAQQFTQLSTAYELMWDLISEIKIYD